MSKDLWIIEYEQALDAFASDMDTIGEAQARINLRHTLTHLGFDADEIDDEIAAALT